MKLGNIVTLATSCRMHPFELVTATEKGVIKGWEGEVGKFKFKCGVLEVGFVRRLAGLQKYDTGVPF